MPTVHVATVNYGGVSGDQRTHEVDITRLGRLQQLQLHIRAQAGGDDGIREKSRREAITTAAKRSQKCRNILLFNCENFTVSMK